MTDPGTDTFQIRSWVDAVRLRTLPLAVSSIAMGAFLAEFYNVFRMHILVWSAITTVLLQILSNLANDYGDSMHGADSEERKGPLRAVQSGAISSSGMKRAIILVALLSFASGITLLYLSFGFGTPPFFFFLILGLVAIAAAVTYTVGPRPYGYVGIGDLSVLLFFGILGVVGSFALHSNGVFRVELLLPAMTMGLFSVAVLNINNIRDVESDLGAGKKSIPVRIGRSNAVRYHWALISLGWFCALFFTWMHFNTAWQLIFLATLPLFISNGIGVSKMQDQPAKLDPFLRQMAMSTLFFILLFGVGLLAG